MRPPQRELALIQELLSELGKLFSEVEAEGWDSTRSGSVTVAAAGGRGGDPVHRAWARGARARGRHRAAARELRAARRSLERATDLLAAVFFDPERGR